MASMSVSGVVSGMDWDSMIDSIIEAASKPAQPKVSKKTNLTNKKSLFEEMKVTMNSLQSSLSPLKLPSTYKAKDIEIERLDNAGSSYKGVLTATVNADAEVNVWEVEVKQLAAAQTNRSKQITDSTLANTLSGVTGSTFYVNAGGQKIGVEVKSSDTLQSLKSRINETLKTLDNPIHVTASVVDNRLILKSDYTGLGTFNSEEKVNYNATGINRLSNFSVNDDERKNVSILNGSTKYTYGTDFEIVNGNEIRWKQYDRSAEVALNDTVNVKYTMAANDVYTASGTYRTNEVDLSKLSWVDNGTLASRLEITDGTDTYKYGQDFTITNGKVVWLEEASETTNEPSSYTVTYNKSEVKTSSASATKSAVGPTSYKVSYSTTTPIASITMSSGNLPVSYSFDGTSTSSTFTGFIQGYADAEGLNSTNELSTTSEGKVSGVSYDYVTNMDNISIDGYEYGKDYVFRKAYGNTNQLVISWNYRNDSAWQYVEDYRANVLRDTSSVTGSYPSAGDVFTIDYTHKYEYKTDDSGDALSDVLATALSDSGSYSGLVVTDSDGNTYSYDNGDFSIIGGQIIWNLTSDDDIDISDIATKFNAVNGTDEIPRVTLTDGNGILRTYLDLADDSSFTMTDEDGNTYEYGRDYVVRVNDDGDGYVVTWAIASDTNGDGKKDIKDADTVLTTYAQYKELSTYGMQAAPDTDKEFDFAFEGTSTTPITGNVKSTDTDKTLSTVLRGTSVSTSDYSSLVITSGTKKYYYGVDFGVDSSGSIVWRDSDSGTMPTSYTVNYAAKNKTLSPSDTGTLTSGASGFPNIDALIDTYGFKTIGNKNLTLDVYNADSPSDYEFVITPPDTSGDYVYGRDYVIQKAGSSNSRNSLIAWGSQSSTYTNEFKTYINSHPSDYDQDTYNAVNGTQLSKPTANYTVSLVHKADSSNLSGVSSCINEANGNYSNLTITDNNGKTYTYVADTADLTYDTFTIVDGLVTFKTAVAPKNPTGAYTLTYVAAGGEALTTDGVKRSATDSTTVAASDLDGGTTTITYGNKTYYEGIDFNIGIGEDSDSNATVEWIPDSRDGYEWYYPTSNATYTINHTDDDGKTTTYSATRTASATLDLSEHMTTANGSISIQYGDDSRYYYLDAPDSGMGDGRTVIKGTYGIDITPTTGNSFTFNWAAPTLTSRSNLPSYGTELTVQYTYDANTFDLADDCDGKLLQALGYTKSDGTYDDYTAAQDAEIYVDGNLSYRASNDIGADYDNELIKGVTMHLKGTGKVVLDISQDAEKAVEAIQTFVDNYNDLMTWMNTRMTEKQVDKDTAATIDNDDFRMRWGLLHGNSLLRQTKTQMRNITSQNFTFSFAQRKSSQEVYGTMAFNGLKSSSTLRLRIGSKFADVTIDPTDTLQTIVAKINDDTKNGPMHNIYYDDSGNKLATPLLKASVENDMLVINSTSGDEITMSGSAAMNALKMNYTYKGLYQIGIESTSDDYGKSGELVFNSGEFMDALQDNPDEVQALMLKFVDQFGTWTRSMLNSSASGETEGTLTREINNIQSQIDDINEYLERYQERLDRMEENLRTRYASTETSLAKLNQQASAMASILQQLSGANNNNQQQ